MKEAEEEGVEVMAVDGVEWVVAQGVGVETRLSRIETYSFVLPYLLLELNACLGRWDELSHICFDSLKFGFYNFQRLGSVFFSFQIMWECSIVFVGQSCFFGSCFCI